MARTRLHISGSFDGTNPNVFAHLRFLRRHKPERLHFPYGARCCPVVFPDAVGGHHDAASLHAGGAMNQHRVVRPVLHDIEELFHLHAGRRVVEGEVYEGNSHFFCRGDLVAGENVAAEVVSRAEIDDRSNAVAFAHHPHGLAVRLARAIEDSAINSREPRRGRVEPGK